MKNTRKLIFAALLAALTFVATSVIKIPTPTMGYVHPGDAFVILCGALLGPVTGGLAAGLGSALSDLLSGYVVYAPATFLIKFLTAWISGIILRFLEKVLLSHLSKEKTALPMSQRSAALLVGGIFGELFMVLGYFLFGIFLLAYSSSGSFTVESLTAGIIASGAGIPFNLVQGTAGVILAAILYPILRRIVNQTTADNI